VAAPAPPAKPPATIDFTDARSSVKRRAAAANMSRFGGSDSDDVEVLRDEEDDDAPGPAPADRQAVKSPVAGGGRAAGGQRTPAGTKRPRPVGEEGAAAPAPVVNLGTRRPRSAAKKRR